MASLVILSAGSAAQSCVILPYCVISIVALFMHLSVMFDAGRQKLGPSWLEGRTVLLCNKQQGEQAKEELEGAGTGRSRGGRLGYEWKHFIPKQSFKVFFIWSCELHPLRPLSSPAPPSDPLPERQLSLLFISPFAISSISLSTITPAPWASC